MNDIPTKVVKERDTPPLGTYLDKEILLLQRDKDLRETTHNVKVKRFVVRKVNPGTLAVQAKI